jgi:hypothetical protein
VTKWVEKIGEKVLEIWHDRKNLADNIRRKKNCGHRHRSIYYDTDSLRETQDETIMVCNDCAGALRIESASDRNIRILAVHIPRKACPACKTKGYEWYEKANPKHFDYIFLQDRTEDRYWHKP